MNAVLDRLWRPVRAVLFRTPIREPGAEEHGSTAGSASTDPEYILWGTVLRTDIEPFTQALLDSIGRANLVEVLFNALGLNIAAYDGRNLNYEQILRKLVTDAVEEKLAGIDSAHLFETACRISGKNGQLARFRRSVCYRRAAPTEARSSPRTRALTIGLVTLSLTGLSICTLREKEGVCTYRTEGVRSPRIARNYIVQVVVPDEETPDLSISDAVVGGRRFQVAPIKQPRCRPRRATSGEWTAPFDTCALERDGARFYRFKVQFYEQPTGEFEDEVSVYLRRDSDAPDTAVDCRFGGGEM
ncbi:MAG: hypothetical protein HOW73_19370 [Polyangiaceae bacterium]|nr:hypothetical protein [Polyangiaceae bacterium]